MPHSESDHHAQVPSTSTPVSSRTVIEKFVTRHELPSGRRQVFAMLPFEFIAGFYETLVESAKVRFIEFSELPFAPDTPLDTEAALLELFRNEFAAWKQQVSAQPPRFNMLIQHDSDDGPLETVYLCELEGELGIKSTTAVFARKIDVHGVTQDYEIDFERLKHLQETKGLCFAYHCNAAELAHYEEAKIANEFDSDVERLESKGLRIGFFSPHGGVSSAQGSNNHSYFYPGLSKRRLIWTHNRFAPSGQRYSDGSWIARIRKPASGLDLRAYMLARLGAATPFRNRHILLLHPQYYFAKDSRAAEPHFAQNPWLEEFWELQARGLASNYWDSVREALRAL